MDATLMALANGGAEDLERAVMLLWDRAEGDDAGEIAEALDMREEAVREVLRGHGWDE